MNAVACQAARAAHCLKQGLAALALLAGLPAVAQVGPSPAEVAAYRGAHAAAWQGDLPALQRLLAQDPPAQAGGAGSASISAPAAARNGRSVPPALSQRDGHGRTPLHVATFARQRAVVKALLQAGADPAALDQDRYDAVTIAAVADDEDTLRVLLANGASASLTTSRYDGTALIAAAHLGHDGVVRQLIAAGAPLDHVNNLHWTAVIESIVLGDGGPRHQATLQALLQAGASTRLTDREGRTPLQLAQARGYSRMVALLTAAGAR